MSDPQTSNKRRAWMLVFVEVLVVGMVLALVAALLFGWWGLPVVVIVVVGALLAVRQAPRIVLRRVGGRPADATVHARLDNLTESLCAAAGLPKPRLVVLDEAAPNAMALGLDPRTAVLVVTQGLLDTLSRIELEGVLAHELSHIKSLDIIPATLAAVFAAPLGVRAVAFTLSPRREEAADASGVAITRYPPGLLAALEKIDADETPPRPRSRTIAHLWLRPPETVGMAGRTLDERIEALREL